MSAVVRHLTAAPVEARLRVKPANPRFTDAVLADLIAIRRTATGRALFRRLRSACRLVTIEKPDPPIDPPNAWTRWRGPAGRGAMEMVIVYDPADWPHGSRLGALPSDAVLFGRLLDAAAMAEGTEPCDVSDGAVPPAIAAYLRDKAGVLAPGGSPPATSVRT
jgi:hypothetical protein